jgi:hypothetical protein
MAKNISGVVRQALKAYLKRAPGARPNLPVDKNAPLSEFEKISAQFPVFRVVSRSAGRNR